MSVDIIQGDCLQELKALPDCSVQACVTSPPYFGLRDYGVAGQIGLEETPEEYVAKLVAVFREVRRVLRDDGALWLNLGDSYSGYHGNKKVPDAEAPSNKAGYVENMRQSTVGVSGLKQKELIGIPWRAAFALQQDGWYLRQDIIWQKPNVMPESVTDRCIKCHEYIFLLVKNAKYFFDNDAIKETAQSAGRKGWNSGSDGMDAGYDGHRTRNGLRKIMVVGQFRNARSVWSISPQAYKGAHFATFPEELPRRCILASSRPGDVILDPFAGSGTTLLMAMRLGRNAIGIELNREYVKIIASRLSAG